jgi:hypothetical protein
MGELATAEELARHHEATMMLRGAIRAMIGSYKDHEARLAKECTDEELEREGLVEASSGVLKDQLIDLIEDCPASAPVRQI